MQQSALLFMVSCIDPLLEKMLTAEVLYARQGFFFFDFENNFVRTIIKQYKN